MEYDEFQKIYSEYLEVPAILRIGFSFGGYVELRKHSTKDETNNFIKTAYRIKSKKVAS